ncbi:MULTISPECIES: serine hydrolase domain-containing protein [Paenibacillus]|uniref:Serine hydrolase n=1 Tax=Paenibacillus albilobatus TaxID=2716884 RepID=A0A920CBA6_9BACL|nr:MULTISPECIES: serine hydrolase domain-containing protein [Paenibacillus]GIO31723.1 serine hydrolase [Paenibacillus albilobatus]
MFERIEEIIENYRRDHVLSGNVFISKEGKEVFSKSYGHASMQLNVPNRIGTKFHIASVTKMFIAAATLKLYEQGLIDLDQHPGAYVEKFKGLHSDITIHHLLSHSSGLQDIYGVPDLRLEMSRWKAENRDFIDYLLQLEQQFKPGERWAYSSTGFIMLGYIFEALTGMAYEEVLDSWFFSPLLMESTGADNPRNINPGRAYGHALENGKITNADNDKLSDADAPGELFSTVRDLDRWCRALFGGELLKQETMDKMFTPYYATSFDPNLSYGYGWFLKPDIRLIGGGTPGFRSEIWHDPANDLRVIMLWNYEKVDSHQLFRLIRPVLLEA